jgi:hypothetical protein
MAIHRDFERVGEEVGVVFQLTVLYSALESFQEAVAVVQPFLRAAYYSPSALKMEVVTFSKTLNNYQSTWRHILEDCNLCLVKLLLMCTLL